MRVRSDFCCHSAIVSPRPWTVLRGVLLLLLVASSFAAHAAASRLSAAIAAQPLRSALVVLSEQTQWQILYVDSLVAHRRSSPVRAGQSPAVALRQMLEGTGLAFETVGEGAVRLVPKPPVVAAVSPVSPLDEVVVVANHREQALLAVPVSARVVNLADLAPFGMASTEQVLSQIPGLEYSSSSQWGAGFYNHLSLRGIIPERSGSTTVVYFDETPLFDALTPHSMFTIPFPHLMDMERIEVLRGPQGVDFGAGAEGGALRFVPRRANTTETSVTGRMEMAGTEGGGGTFGGEGVVALPVVAGLLGLRLSAFARDEGGYVDRIDPFTGATVASNANRTALRAFRLSADYEPSDSLVIRPVISVQSTRVADSPMLYLGASDPARGVFRNGKLMAQPFDETLAVGTLRVQRRWPTLTLTSVTSFAQRDDQAVIDRTNEAGVFYFGGYGDPRGPELPVSYANAVTDRARARLRMVSQEVRLAPNPAPLGLDWSAGLFYAHYARSQSEASYLVPWPETAALSQKDDDKASEFSAFAQARWAVGPRWKVGAGVRVGSFRSSTESLEGGLLVGPGVPTLVRNSGALPVTPRVDVAYQATPGWLWYAVASRGARVGRAALPRLCHGEVAGNGYGDDSLVNYEIGVKGALGSDRLTLDASVYDIEWHNVQMWTYDACGHSYMTSAGNAVSRGVDLSVQARPHERLLLSLDVATGTVHSRDTVYGAGGLLVAQQGAALSGVPDVPAPWSGNLRVHYTQRVTPDLLGFVNLLWSVRSHHPGPFPELNPLFPTYDPRFAADPATQQWNLSVGISRGPLEAHVYVDNLLNERPALQLSGDAPGTPLLYGYSRRPRTLGLMLQWQH